LNSLQQFVCLANRIIDIPAFLPESPAEFEEWYCNLDDYDQQEVDLLKLMLVYDLLDEVDDLTEAREVIDRVK
jgi:hypothetical protein